MNFTILHAQAVRFCQISEKEGGTYIPDAIKAVKEKYGFLQVPKRIEDFDWNKGIVLNHGKFLSDPNAAMVIDALKIYHNGVVAETRSPNEMADKFIDDFLQFAKETGFLSIEDIEGLPVPRAYQSNLEVVLPIEIEEFVPEFPFNVLAQGVTKHLQQLGFKNSSYRFAGFSLHTDTEGLNKPTPIAFTFERRAGISYGEHKYFTSAPLKTIDHLGVIHIFVDYYINKLKTPRGKGLLGKAMES